MSESFDHTSSLSVQESAQKILASITIPSPPRVLIGIQEELSKAEPSFTKVLAFISEDVALTAKVIKVANSPFFATRYPIKGLETALPILGLDNFRNIILTSALRTAFKQTGLPQEEMNTFHEHSLIVARTCQTISMHLDRKVAYKIDTGLAYMAGLFHDCGMPLLGQRFPQYYNDLRAAGHNADLLQFEENRYRTNHCIIGTFVARAWQLPEELNEAISQHHTTFTNQHDDKALILAALIRTAEGLIEHVADIPDQDAVYFQHSDDQVGFQSALSLMAIPQDDLEALIQKIGQMLSNNQSL
ncbi:HDOD domain-containing protein [bacterium]|nr:HDOD domain-containing protein [bacterium]